MKTILLVIVAAAVASLITYKLLKQEEKGMSYILRTPDCEWIRLKVDSTDEAAVKKFEILLETVDPNARRGTHAVLRYTTPDGKVVEVEGPSQDHNDFTPANSVCPAGSMHHTQKIATANQADYKTVLDSLDFASQGATPSPIPTPTP